MFRVQGMHYGLMTVAGAPLTPEHKLEKRAPVSRELRVVEQRNSILKPQGSTDLNNEGFRARILSFGSLDPYGNPIPST